MSAFVDNCIFHSRETVEDHSAGAAFDIVDGGLCEGYTDGYRDCVPINGTKSVSHDEESGKESKQSEIWERRCSEFVVWRRPFREGKDIKIEVQCGLA